MLQELDHFGRYAAWIALFGTFPGQTLQVIDGAHAFGREFDRVLVPELVQLKSAAGRNLFGAPERIRRRTVQPLELRQGPQMITRILKTLASNLLDRLTVAYRNEAIMEQRARGLVILHISAGNQRN